MIKTKRVDLAREFPLSGPLSLILEPTNLCNFACVYCPTSDPDLLRRFKVPKGNMDMKLYGSIMDSLAEFQAESGSGPLKKLLLYKDGEPLLHPRLPEMIALARQKGIAREIWVTTNGRLLSPELNLRLIEAGLSGIRVSVVSMSTEGYRELAGVGFDLNRLRDNLGHLKAHRTHTKIIAKMIDAGLPGKEKQAFDRFFSPVTDGCFLEEVTGWSLSAEKDFTLGQDLKKVVEKRSTPHKQVCASPFYSLAVNFNGMVSACCVDWAYKTILGDLSKQSFAQVWRGEALREFRRMHLMKQRSQNPACRNCDYMATHPDYLDPWAEEMLARL
jgi:radical SAM protein with 4Fe4S-binding SPASM domain